MPFISTTIESNLYDCLSLCRQRDDCNGINHNGHHCQVIINVDDDVNRLIKSNQSAVINIHAKKICITGMRIFNFCLIFNFFFKNNRS